MQLFRLEEEHNLQTDQTVIRLRNELERCLRNYKTKKTQADQAQNELKATQTQLGEVKEKLVAAEETSADAQVLSLTVLFVVMKLIPGTVFTHI